MKTRSKATLTLRAMLARRYGFGASPNKPPLCHLWPQRHCLPFSGTPEKYPKNKKNEGPFYLTSVSLAFCSPSAVASMTVNSFSSIVLSSLSICWRQSLSPFCLSG
mgnify:FL=1